MDRRRPAATVVEILQELPDTFESACPECGTIVTIARGFRAGMRFECPACGFTADVRGITRDVVPN
jgi:predicted RNA-binding Zn-ribbon protein involved in translation (DUF1610 family)